MDLILMLQTNQLQMHLDPGDIVTDVFNYTVSDGNGGTDIATITITSTCWRK